MWALVTFCSLLPNYVLCTVVYRVLAIYRPIVIWISLLSPALAPLTYIVSCAVSTGFNDLVSHETKAELLLLSSCLSFNGKTTADVLICCSTRRLLISWGDETFYCVFFLFRRRCSLNLTRQDLGEVWPRWRWFHEAANKFVRWRIKRM